ncbi:MAG: family 20 glycosylhydrolase, partial [Dokdonella sp.]
MRMRIVALFILIAALCGCAGSSGRKPAASASLSLIPLPAQMERADGRFVLRDGAPLVVDGGDAETVRIAREFADMLARTRGLHLDVLTTAVHDARAAIIFSLDAPASSAASPEAYELTIDSHQIRVSARAPRGLFYGTVTLWQLLTQEGGKTASIEVPALRIIDAPRFAWRGAMLDSARHFQSPDFIKHFIDQLALAKLNIFHWHLTDDQGWRIEIKKYPRLTEVGAWRKPAGA